MSSGTPNTVTVLDIPFHETLDLAARPLGKDDEIDMFFKEPKTPAECLDYALICEEQAKLTHSAALRNEILDLARQWREMAERLERSQEG